jgi:hypothetical protein
MKVGGSYDSPQKQAVRERLWDPAVQDLIDNHQKDPTKLRFLDLPGADCLYLQQIIDRFGVMKENIVAVEQYEEARLAIHRFLGGKGVVRLGRIEELAEAGELRKYFPIDVVNLDFCGQGFVFPDLGTRTKENMEYQRRWDCVKKAIDYNREKEQDVWYLLLTLGCDRNNDAGKKYLVSRLESLTKITGIAKHAKDWRGDRLIQEVVPKIVADEALQRDYLPSAATFDSYRYVQEGHKFHMVAWRFKFEIDATKTLGQNVTRRKERLDAFCRAYFAADGKELEL